MSKVNREVELTPPTFRDLEERLVSVGHRCGYCHGQGWIWSEDDQGESAKRPCPVCEGHTEMDAVIDIHWQPSVHDHRQSWMKPRESHKSNHDDGTTPRTISFAR